MSRSYKKHPFTGITCASSEKENKKRYHRDMRHEEKRRLQRALVEDKLEEYITTLPNEVSDIWGFAKDGKMQIDPETNPELMRK